MYCVLLLIAFLSVLVSGELRTTTDRVIKNVLQGPFLKPEFQEWAPGGGYCDIHEEVALLGGTDEGHPHLLLFDVSGGPTTPPTLVANWTWNPWTETAPLARQDCAVEVTPKCYLFAFGGGDRANLTFALNEWGPKNGTISPYFDANMWSLDLTQGSAGGKPQWTLVHERPEGDYYFPGSLSYPSPLPTRRARLRYANTLPDGRDQMILAGGFVGKWGMSAYNVDMNAYEDYYSDTTYNTYPKTTRKAHVYKVIVSNGSLPTSGLLFDVVEEGYYDFSGVDPDNCNMPESTIPSSPHPIQNDLIEGVRGHAYVNSYTAEKLGDVGVSDDGWIVMGGSLNTLTVAPIWGVLPPPGQSGNVVTQSQMVGGNGPNSQIFYLNLKLTQLDSCDNGNLAVSYDYTQIGIFDECSLMLKRQDGLGYDKTTGVMKDLDFLRLVVVGNLGPCFVHDSTFGLTDKETTTRWSLWPKDKLASEVPDCTAKIYAFPARSQERNLLGSAELDLRPSTNRMYVLDLHDAWPIESVQSGMFPRPQNGYHGFWRKVAWSGQRPGFLGVFLPEVIRIRSGASVGSVFWSGGWNIDDAKYAGREPTPRTHPDTVLDPLTGKFNVLSSDRTNPSLKTYLISLGCPSGSQKASAGCKSCALGKYLESNATMCQSCEAEHVRAFTHMDVCSACDTGELAVMNGTECSTCPVGKVLNRTGQFCYDCLPGSVTNNLRTFCMPCKTGFYYDAANKECNQCDFGQYSDEEGALECTPCQEGASTVLSGSTSLDECVCMAGYYGSKKCSECPIGGVCPGGTVLPNVQPGYYRSPIDNASMLACVPPTACLGGNESTCEAGYGGLGCMTCDKNYHKVQDQCAECGSGSGFIYIIMFVMFLILIVLGRGSGRPHHGVSLWSVGGVAINYLQIVSLLPSVHLDWTNWMTYILMQLGSAQFNVDTVDLLNCGGDPPDAVSRYWTSMMAPVVWIAATAVAGFVPAFIRRCMNLIGKASTLEKRSRKVYFAHLINTSLALLSWHYLTLCLHTFALYDCRESEDGSYLFEGDLTISCDSEEYAKLQSNASYGMLLYVIGIPVVFLIIMIANRKKVHQVEVLRRFGFLFAPYDSSLWWYELKELAQRFFFAVVVQFFGVHTAMQTLMMFMIIMLATIVHAALRPYRLRVANSAAYVSMLMLSFMFFIALVTFQLNSPKAIEARMAEAAESDHESPQDVYDEFENRRNWLNVAMLGVLSVGVVFVFRGIVRILLKSRSKDNTRKQFFQKDIDELLTKEAAAMLRKHASGDGKRTLKEWTIVNPEEDEAVHNLMHFKQKMDKEEERVRKRREKQKKA